MNGTSKTEEVVRVIGALRAELTRLRQIERNYAKLLEALARANESLIARRKGEKALAEPVREARFQFSLSVDQHTPYSASNLVDFCKLLETVPVQSLEFHLGRGDFETWLKYIGLEEAAARFAALRGENLPGESLRSRLIEAVKPYVRAD